ncbi:Flp family type IVb pilin [Thalassobacillus devorans]|uniref:Flp family type IVb pilin n=1 Tax=Thalassobacillus devorans TaxID=279813 RepID=UPI000A1CDE6F|nr:Flp family type IVb pilin [Thalassobacillus devorans]
MLEMFKGLLVEEEGQGMTEYGLILGLIAVGVIGALAILGDKISEFFTKINTELE